MYAYDFWDQSLHLVATIFFSFRKTSSQDVQMFSADAGFEAAPNFCS